MRNYIYNISNGFASRVARIGKVLSVLFLLALSSSVLGSTLDYGTTDSGLNNSVSSIADNTYIVALPGGNNYLRISDGDLNSSYSFNDPSSVTNNHWRQERDSRYFIGISLKAAGTYIVKYTQSSFEIGLLSWKLCGEFTDWTPAYAPEFTGSGSEVSLQIYLPYNTTYPKATDNRGFKIVASAGNTNVWYGCDAVMDKDHCTDYTFATNESKNCGLTTYWSGYYTFVFNTSTHKLTINFPDAPTSVPVAYWGAEPQLQNSSTYTNPQRQDIEASAYIASQGCGGGSAQSVDKIRVRFWKNGDAANADVIELTGTYTINTAYPITIPADNDVLLNSLESTDKIIMEVAAHNANGWSAYSDQMEIDYTAPSAFIVNNLSGLNFNACDGSHQFTLKDMVKPVPSGWSVVNSSNADANADFTLKDGVMIWNTAGKSAGNYTYTFTFTKEEYSFPAANATLSFYYSAEEIAKDIESLTASASTTTPWTEVTLTATYPADKDFNSVVWSVDKSSGYSLVSSTFGETSATAVFKGSTVFASTDYNITAKGRSENCITSTGKSVKVTVNEDATDCTQTAQVLRAADPVVAVGPRVTLSGYMKYRGNGGSCVDDFTTYGFCYSTDESLIDGTADLNVSGVTYKSKTGAALTESNRNWNYTIADGLAANTTYYYKAYIVSAGGVKVFSDKGSFTTGEACKHPVGDPINYYINASYDENDPCDLMFTNIEDALANLKTHTGSDNDDWWDDTNKMLKANVVFNVYPGTYGSGISSTIDFSDINKYSSSVTPVKRLTIVGTDATNKPVIYGMYMANSRWITVQNVRVERKTTGSNLTQSSILVGFNDENNSRTVGEMTNAGLEFIKCDIEVDGFTCIHANGVDGFSMNGCNLIADRTEAIQDNDRNWGASIKFMNSKNIKLLRNNFRGSHANNIFFQNSRETLIMNNVFWNDNKVTYSSTTNNPSFIRLVNFQANNAEHNITNVGIYYNTFYLANSDASGEDSKKFDFVAFSGKAQNDNDGGFKSDRYDVANIHFQYNNCYSYSTLNSGRSGDQFQGKDVTGTFKYNNFWSAKSGATSSFAFGSDYQTVDMSLTGGMICSTAPYDPDGLVIRGSSLDLGGKITSDASGMGAENISDDRLRDAVRPASGSGWTYGAYQKSEGETLDVIYWLGTQDNEWNNRNNWYKLVNGEYQLVTCVDNFSDNLMAVIPEQTGEDKKYPFIPAWESTHEGHGTEGVFTSDDKFAKTIDIKYGASTLGVENLKEGDGTYRYYEGVNHLDADRKEWLMVGTVIRPFNDLDKAATAADTTARLVKSGDFYRNHLPHIYMQKFGYSGTAVDWDSPFTQLDESVPVDKCFTIFCADQYGPKKRTAAMYYGDASKGKELIEYSFKGRYAAENGLPSYSFTNGNYYFVNNYYPANIKASAFNGSNTVKYYDTKTGAWNDITPGASTNVEIRPQNGVLVVPTSTNTVNLTAEDFTVNSTKYKSVAVNQGLTLFAVATATGKGSNVGVWQQYKNIVKAENASDNDVCELYISCGGVNLSTISYLDADTVLALGIHNKLYDAMSVRFELVESSLLSEVYLEDRAADPVVRYDLLAGEKPYFANIPAGYSEGRFYLVLGDGMQSETDIPTPAKAEEADKFSIDVFVNKDIMTVSASAGATIEKITMFDMAGKAYSVPVNGSNLSESRLSVVKGVYSVTVVTDKGTETKKIIVK